MDKPHSKSDKIKYYNFTDTGYVYLKDSGLVDKNDTYSFKKETLLNRISNTDDSKKDTFIRIWSNFYEVNKELEVTAQIDPSKIRTNKEEADITFENITIKKMLNEKSKLISSVNNKFKDIDGAFENYIIKLLSED